MSNACFIFRLARIVAVFSALISAGVAGAGTTVSLPQRRGAALADARALAARHPSASVCVVKGQSMLPYFADGSVLVMKPIASSRLRTGMIVVYTNRLGETVCHRVIGLTEDGWRVRGYNNDRADSTLVNDSNLQGVVYAIFHPPGGEEKRVDTAVAGDVPVALAASAR